MAWNLNLGKPDANVELKPGEEAAKPAPEKSVAELIAEALQPVTQGFTTLNERLNTIETNTQKPSRVAEEGAPVTPSVFENEDAAFSTRMTPLLVRQLELEARMVKNDIKREYESAGFGDMWNQYAADIDKQLDASPIVGVDGKPLRGSPDYIRNVADMVLGRAARTSGVRFDGKNKTFFLEGASGSADAGAQGGPTNDGLTDKQRKMFQRMGIPLDKAKDTLGKLTFVN